MVERSTVGLPHQGCSTGLSDFEYLIAGGHILWVIEMF
jgi:hypothetical protein